MQKKIRWGIMGAGAVIHRWIKGAVQLEDLEIKAISSRCVASAKEVAERWDIPCVMTYDEMVNCPDIDIVYIAVPHTVHRELALKAMNAGKNVLLEKPATVNAEEFQELIECAKINNVFLMEAVWTRFFALKAMNAGKNVLLEKPATVNAEEFQELIECAKINNVFLMEAVWTRFFPVIQKALNYIENGRIGEIRTVESNFSFRVADNDRSRLTDPLRGGGGLLDTGVYNLHFAYMVYNKAPVHMKGMASIDTDEHHFQVDEQAAYIGQYDHGELAIMMSGIRTETLHTAYIYGTKGYMVIPVFWKPTKLEVVIGEEKEIVENPVSQKIDGIVDEGYQYEIAYVNRCIREGIKESSCVPWNTSLNVLRQMDGLRKDWGLIYPSETKGGRL